MILQCNAAATDEAKLRVFPDGIVTRLWPCERQRQAGARKGSVLIYWSAAVSQTSRSIFDVLRLTLRAQPRSENSKSGHYPRKPSVICA